MKRLIYLGCVILAVVGFLFLFEFKGNFINISNVPNSRIEKKVSTLTELDKTQVIAISEILLEEFQHARSLINAIIKAGSSIIILTKSPVDTANKVKWLTKYKLEDTSISAHLSLMPVVHDSYWVRDFSPIPFKFLSDTFDRYFLGDFRFRTAFKANDTVPYQMALYMNLNLIHAPVLMDGGNFISNGESCVVTSDIAEESDIGSSQQSIRKIFKDSFGCEKLFILNDTPHEHADMFIKFIDKNTLLVNMVEAPSDLLKGISEEDLFKTYEVKRQLDKVAKYLEKYFKVVRMPMPLISNDIFRTYANSLIVNKTAIIPSYKLNKTTEQSFPDIEFLKAQEKVVEDIFRTFGYKPVFVNSDELIAHGGSLHCVTSLLPAGLKK